MMTDQFGGIPLDGHEPLPATDQFGGIAISDQQPTDHAAIAGAKIRQSPVSPDQYAEASTLGQQIGVPAPVAARNLDQSRQIKQNQDLRQFAEAHAAGALWLAQGDHAALSHDDLDAMGRISTAGQAIGHWAGNVRAPIWVNGPANEDTSLLSDPSRTAAFAQGALKILPETAALAAHVVGSLMGFTDTIFGTHTIATDNQDLIFKNIKDLSSAYADQLSHTAAAQAHPTFNKVGDVGGTLASFFVGPGLEQGGIKASESAAPWIAKFAADPRVQRFLGHAVEQGVRNLPAAVRIAAQHVSDISTQQAKAGVPLAQQYKDAAVGLPLETFSNSAPMFIPGGKIVRAISGEAVGLGLNAGQQAIEHAVDPSTFGPVQAPDFTNPATYLPAALAVLFGSRGTKVEPPPAKIEAAAQALDSMTHTPDRVETSLHNAEQLHQVMEAAQQSKLMTRSPETLTSFVRATADHTVYLPVDKVDEHLTSQGIDPAAEIAAITGGEDAYTNAKETGTLAIPLSDYAVRGQELHAALGSEAKLDEGGLAPSEVPDAIQAHHDVMDSALQDHFDAVTQAVDARDNLSPSPPSVDEFLTGLRQEVGWDQRGGLLLRAQGKEHDAVHAEVIGRTKWIGKIGPDGQESRFWRMRPESINVKDAHDALEKQAAGEKLRPIQQRFIDYARKYAQGQLDDYKAQANESPTSQRLIDNAGFADQRASQRGEADLGFAVRGAENTSGKNAVTEAEAERDGILRTFSDASLGNKELLNGAMETAARHPFAGLNLTAELLANRRPATDKETTLLLVDRARIHNDAAIARATARNKEGKTDSQQAADLVNLERVEQQRRDNDLAYRQSGTDNSGGLRARQMVISLDYKLETMLQDTELARGGRLNPKVTAKIETMAKEIEHLREQMAERDAAAETAKASTKAPKGPKKTIDQRMQERLHAEIAKLDAEIHERLKACPV